MTSKLKPKDVPTIPCDIIEDDILLANEKGRMSPIALDELFQAPKSSNDHRRLARDSHMSMSIDENDILFENTKSKRAAKRSNYDLNIDAELATFSDRCIPRHFQDFSPAGASTLKRFRHMINGSASSKLSSIQSLYEAREDVFRTNLVIECDLARRSKSNASRALSSRLRPLSKPSLLVAQNLPSSGVVDRAVARVEEKWTTLDPLNVMAGGFYARSPDALAPLEYRTMSGRLQQVLYDCAGVFSDELAEVCPEDYFDDVENTNDVLLSEETKAFAKLEETGQKIFRQMTQYMNFVATSKQPTKATNTTYVVNKGEQVKQEEVSATGSLFPIVSAKAAKSELSFDRTHADISSFESFLENAPPNQVSSFIISPNKTADKAERGALGKEDGELSENGEIVESDGERRQSEGDSSENDSADTESTTKKKKKKRKKSKSSSVKKERKKKKKERRSRDERSPDDLPRAYKSNYDDDRPHYRSGGDGRTGPYQQRSGYQPYHNQRGGGYHNMRYNNNFRYRGRGGNFRPYGGYRGGRGGGMNQHYMSQRGRPAGLFSHQRMLREKRFVSESESDDDMRRSRDAKRRRSTSKRDSRTPEKATANGGGGAGASDDVAATKQGNADPDVVIVSDNTEPVAQPPKAEDSAIKQVL